MVGSLRAKLVSRLERRRSMLFLTGVPGPDAAVEDRRPAFRVAAAWREDKEGVDVQNVNRMRAAPAAGVQISRHG